MKLKQQQYKCDACQIGIELAHPKCSRCGKQMRVEGDRFFDFVKVHNLRRSRQFDEEEGQYYVFDLTVGPVITNGMTYNASNRSVMFPAVRGCDGRKVRFTNAPGAFVAKLRQLIEQQIEQRESSDEFEEEERVAA